MSNLRQPETVTVAVSRADGGLTVLRIITAEYEPDGEAGRRKRWEVESTPEYIESIIAKHAWTGDLAPVSWRIVPDDFVDQDTDRTYRDAWKDNGGHKPAHDMGKAREIHRNRLRELRAPLLEALDVEYMRADERGDQQEKKRIGERKKALRDVTDDLAIEAAQTIDELKAVIPGVLNG